MVTNMEEELLQALARMTGCMYLSDLRTPRRRVLAWAALQQIPFGEYPAQQWRAAALYLTAPEP